MYEGKKEFQNQLEKWSDIFQEAQEDIDDICNEHDSFGLRVKAIEKYFEKITKTPMLKDRAIEISGQKSQKISVNNLFSGSRAGTNAPKNLDDK